MRKADRDEREGEVEFDRRLRAWAARSTHRPPGAAAAELATRLGRQRGRLSQLGDRLAPRSLIWPGWVLAAVGLFVVGILATVQLRRQDVPPGAAPVVTPALILGEGEVLIWLDERTPLYMNLAPPRGGAEVGGES